MKNGKNAIRGFMLICAVGARIFAEELPAKDVAASTGTGLAATGSKGFYLSLPAYLYAENSTFGLQAGYQFEKTHIRLDMNFAENYRNDGDVWIFMPSIGVFFSKDFYSLVRFYEGLTFGAEKGMVNSFDGVIGFLNYIAGAEFLSFGKKTFFIEVGSGAAFSKEEGAYMGGTIVGGGFKAWF